MNTSRAEFVGHKGVDEARLALWPSSATLPDGRFRIRNAKEARDAVPREPLDPEDREFSHVP